MNTQKLTTVLCVAWRTSCCLPASAERLSAAQSPLGRPCRALALHLLVDWPVNAA
jgi:hypothetical protein